MKTSAMMRCPKCEQTSELDNLHLLDQSFKRTWVGLTDSQIEQVYNDLVKTTRGAPMPWGQINFGKTLQALIKEKNT